MQGWYTYERPSIVLCWNTFTTRVLDDYFVAAIVRHEKENVGQKKEWLLNISVAKFTRRCKVLHPWTVSRFGEISTGASVCIRRCGAYFREH